MRRIRILQGVAIAASLVFLLGMVSPTLDQSREKIHRARCVSNLKTLWSAFLTFTKEHDGHLPAAGRSGRDAEHDWTWGGNVIAIPQTDPAACRRIEIEKGSIWPYVTGMRRVGPYGGGIGPKDAWYADPAENIYLCPTAGPVGKKRGLSYSMNYYVEFPPGGVSADIIGIKLSEVKNRARTILLLEESELTVNDGSFNPTSFEKDAAVLGLKHSEGGHLLLCDGHVAWMEKARLRKLIDADSEYFRPDL